MVLFGGCQAADFPHVPEEHFEMFPCFLVEIIPDYHTLIQLIAEPGGQ